MEHLYEYCYTKLPQNLPEHLLVPVTANLRGALVLDEAAYQRRYMSDMNELNDVNDMNDLNDVSIYGPCTGRVTIAQMNFGK